MMTRLLPSALLVAVSSAAMAQTGPDTAAFVTRLGTDTLAVERVVRMPRRIEADVVLRIPQTTRTQYVLELSSAGDMVRMQSIQRIGAEVIERETVERLGDSLRIVTITDAGERVRTLEAEARTLPFIDMVHWPYEIALMRVRASGSAEASIPLLTGSRTALFAFAVVGPDSMTITHPTRGTMRLKVDRAGRLLSLDAGATTRKLSVERRPTVPLDDLTERWTAADGAGRGLGALSGRASVETTVAGATITVDHGTPSKRGRVIWGSLVPFGEVWRTGANRATHFTTDRDLVLGSGEQRLEVPAGSYTLFSIPEANGGTLIVNRQTGQTGTAYNADRDLGRVSLAARPLPDEVEAFTIAVTEEGSGGLVRLQWDRTELVVPFVVNP